MCSPPRSPRVSLSRLTSQHANRMEMLVLAPAAVEDALASLLVEASVEPGVGVPAGGTDAAATAHHCDVDLQMRAAATYIRRVYHPYLLRDPVFDELGTLPQQQQVQGASLPQQQQQQVQGAGAALSVLWMFDDPALSNTPSPQACVGALLVVKEPGALQRLLQALGANMATLGLTGQGGSPLPGTLHVVFTGKTCLPCWRVTGQ